MERIREKLDALYRRYDFVSNKQEMTVFIIKIMVLKLLENRGLINLDKKMARKLQDHFTVQSLMSCWRGESDGIEEWFFEKDIALSDLIWSDVYEIVKEAPVFDTEKPDIIGEIYEACLQKHHKKNQGIFYTPAELADYMVSLGLEQETFKVLDPACGSASLLSAVYDRVMRETPEEQRDEMHHLLLEQRLYGIDKDPVAALVTRLILAFKQDDYAYPKNIYAGDALLECPDEIKPGTFDLIIANPPYIGHKEIDAEYMQALKECYSEVYKNKADLSYCFFALGLKLLKTEGRLVFLTSRYYMEAYNAKTLRETLTEQITIDRIIDFNGLRIIHGVGVDPAIICLRQTVPIDHIIDVTRFYPSKGSLMPTTVYLEDIRAEIPQYCERFKVNQSELNPDLWELYSDARRKIISKIEEKSPFTLENLVDSFQGIITGNDKVFIFDREDERKAGFSEKLMHPWIKNKDIRAFKIAKPQKEIFYTCSIESLSDYPEEEKYLLPFKEKLLSRRECKNGRLPWYSIQWGRDEDFFKERKIVFPYKAVENRFAIDDEGLFFSADVYGLKMKEVLYCQMDEKTLVLLLNSRLYNYYFHSFAKKLGADLYEYYPNTLLKLRIPEFNDEMTGQFKAVYDKIINLMNTQDVTGYQELLKQTDQWIYDCFDLTEEEIREVERGLSENPK